MAHRMARGHYAGIFGPTTGDRVQLGDTELVAEVEQDATTYGDELAYHRKTQRVLGPAQQNLVR